MAESGELGEERAAEFLAMGHVERAVAEAVIAAFKGEDASFSGVERGGFEGGFDSFKSGVAEDRLAGRLATGPSFEGDPAEFVGEFAFEPMRMDVPHGVEKSAHLALTCPDDARIGVTGGGDAEGGRQIEVF